VSLGHVGVWRSVGNLPAKFFTSVEGILGEELIKSSGELTYMCSVWGFPAPTEFLSDITCYLELIISQNQKSTCAEESNLALTGGLEGILAAMELPRDPWQGTI
jgi:hypothetical protein